MIDEYSFRGGNIRRNPVSRHFSSVTYASPDLYTEWRKLKDRTATDSDIEVTIPIKDTDSGKSITQEYGITHKGSHTKILDGNGECVAKTENFCGNSVIPNANTNHNSQESGKYCLTSIFSFAVFRNVHFVIFVTAYFFGCVSQSLPIICIPDIANDNNIDKRYSAMLISLVRACDVIGRSSMGILSDRKYVDRKILIFISMVITGVAE